MLDTKLFKPSTEADEHEPVHRIMAEFLAGRYLADRISNPSDRLSLKRCLSIVAPNGVVRDELRGMIGWLAAMGDERIQSAIVDIDPYAVISNGDPAQLSSKNKIRLIEKLDEVATNDPSFRREDVWRTFNVGRFFTSDVVEALKPIILSGKRAVQLKALIFELLHDAPVVTMLSKELKLLLINENAESYERIAAARLLFSHPEVTFEADIDRLLSEKTATSTQIITEMALERGMDTIGFDRGLSLLRQLASLYPGERARRSSSSRHFIQEFLRNFPSDDTADYLDAICNDVKCTCNAKRWYTCSCRSGISKVMGGLLDRHMSAPAHSRDAAQIWKWTRNLLFPMAMEPEDSASVAALAKDYELRRAVQRVAMSEATTLQEYEEVVSWLLSLSHHSGLRLSGEDMIWFAGEAFDEDNLLLWETMYHGPSVSSSLTVGDHIRKDMRRHAREKAAFMQIWAKKVRWNRERIRKEKKQWPLRDRVYERRRKAERDKHFAYIAENRSTIERGEDHWWVNQFTHYFLHQPDQISEFVDEIATVEKTLLNSLQFLKQRVPTLEQLSRYEDGATDLAETLFAICLLTFRTHGDLRGQDMNTLKAAKTVYSPCAGVEKAEAQLVEAAIDAELFKNAGDAERFAREWIEPTLSGGEGTPPLADKLAYIPAFKALQKHLPTEWLRRFTEMPYRSERELFRMAARHAPEPELLGIIRSRCNALRDIPHDPANPVGKHRREFWLINSLIYDDDRESFDQLATNRDSLLRIIDRLDNNIGNQDETPNLTAAKIYDIVDAYIGLWPKVCLPRSHGSSSPPASKPIAFCVKCRGG